MWDYRVVKHKIKDEVCYGIREVFYNDDKSIYAMTKEDMSPFGNDIDELQSDLVMMLHALTEPILVDGEIEFDDPDFEKGVRHAEHR